MVTRYDCIKALEKNKNNDLWCYYDKDADCIRDSKTNEEVCSLDVFVEYMAKKMHCNFEVIYSEHVSLTTIYRCKECGTVIFGGDDERWDPNLKCPHCSDYKPHTEFWDIDDINKDPEKQRAIEEIIKDQEWLDERDRRVESRNGLNDWEIWKKKFYFKNKTVMYEVSLECSNLFETGLKGLNLHISKFAAKKGDNIGLYGRWFKRIPLSPYAFYLQCIFPYSKKCIDEGLRKYHWWQKKPVANA